MKIIIDSSPLIILAKLNLLPSLKNIFQKIIIPEIIYNEVVNEGILKGKQDAIAIKLFIEKEPELIEIIKDVPQIQYDKYQFELDAGEMAVLNLSKTQQPDLIIIDEELARGVARQLGLKFKGTLGVLINLYKANIISFNELSYYCGIIKSRKDIWIHSELIDKVLAELKSKMKNNEKL